ncbi:DUF2214 family protein [Photobacterium sp. WH77]|uniref:DUF2214 family protein n=1 Tax=Photobacterium arenosum TaxID=2774143 RepID=A0ABR9BI28_9GAMM|nr:MULTISPECIES: DUF2214 family protein [Photobacterium]MBD8512206.1 DUF2214 family protein [Photobacterium arenosum]MBV7263633.1 DUF2214 family protein [Photobacterium sp. WH24]MCG2836492.1 DUF2214 family protein [Photobacterium sp. WH77]MCG2843881.1 DUF2214 family protein [Photobacterium sp. WH80]MDO6581278.1 DUF2214 family protein [Photobacterium sp. 2_MG-2023]
MFEIVIRYFHFIGIFALFSVLVVEHMLIKRRLTAEEMHRLARLDAVYGISAVVVLLAGLAMWFLVGKPADFYTANPVFHAKVTLFLIVAALSVFPTVFFYRHRRTTRETIPVPPAIVILIRLELLLLLVIPLLAVLMARGVGLG